MTEILIIAVTYNTYKQSIQFLKSIEAQKCTNVKVVLVDNSDTKLDLSFKENIKSLKIDVTYLKSEINLGYFGGADYGLSVFLQNNSLPNWVIVSNVDIAFNQIDFFEKLLNINLPETVAVIAPSIISNKWKTDANPKILNRYSKQKMNFYLFVCGNVYFQNVYSALSFLKKKLKYLSQKYFKKSLIKKEIINKKIYAPHGSCIIFNKKYFKLGGNLKHFSFLFGEEIFVAETLIKLHLEALYEPKLTVTDYEHASTGFFYSNKIASYMKQSTHDIINHYYNKL